MENPDPGELFEATFTPEVTAAIVEALRAAYDTACEHHVPEQGSNETTFGFNLYHHAVHELCNASGRVTTMKVESRRPTFRLRRGEYKLACHRVGSSEHESIWGAFPGNDGAARTMVEEPLWLPALVPFLGVEHARKLVIAHLGSPEDGLRAVYLCIPGTVENGRIASWVFARPLWTADGQQVADESRRDLAAEEVVGTPVVTRKPKAVDDFLEEPPKVAPEEDRHAEVQRKATSPTKNKGGDGEIG